MRLRFFTVATELAAINAADGLPNWTSTLTPGSAHCGFSKAFWAKQVEPLIFEFSANS